MIDIKTYKSKIELAQNFSEYFLKLTNRYAKENKNIHVALSGGSTPKIWFKVLKDNYLKQINWQRIHFYWGDERMVPSESPESNYGEALRFLLNCKEIPKENIHPINGEAEIEKETLRYANVLRNNLSIRNNTPSFDLIILGMGDDGHTASIFPNQMNLLTSDKICETAMHPISGEKRITLTGPTINNAQQVAFLITGENKADKLACIINKKEDSLRYPAAHIKPLIGNTLFFLDKEAAQQLS
jgi:6-phosphogluconolactonase